MINDWWRGKQKQRAIAHCENHAGAEALLAYLRAPEPTGDSLVSDVEYLALDFETTGLNPRKDRIVSIGWTVVRNQRVVLSLNRHLILKQSEAMPPQSVAVHQITDDQVRTGLALSDALLQLLQAMTGRVVLVHYHPIEQRFLAQALQREWGVPIAIPMVDTMMLLKRLADTQPLLADTSQLRLHNARRSYGLPRYGAHNALEDAVATAELFLTMQAQHKQFTGKLSKILV